MDSVQSAHKSALKSLYITTVASLVFGLVDKMRIIFFIVRYLAD